METKEIKINLPIDITTLDEIGNVTATIENGSIVITCEPKKKEFKYGDFVRLDRSGNTGIIQTKKKIQKFLDDNNLVIDYEKKKIVKKRWRAEKDETFYCVTSCGIVLERWETYNENNKMLFNSGNYFQTKEQAENAAKEIKNFLKGLFIKLFNYLKL